MLDALAAMPGVVHFGKGVDNIDVAAATAARNLGGNVRDANWDEVSNHVLALLLAWARGLVAVRPRRPRGRLELSRDRYRVIGSPVRSLGIVGFGDIARVLAAKAHALGLTVLAYARRPISDPARDGREPCPSCSARPTSSRSTSR